MAAGLEINFSNRLDVLYERLKQSLFGHPTTPFMKRLVVVYSPAMKTWLMLRMAQDPELNVAAGIEFLFLNEAFAYLLKLSNSKICTHFPSSFELALAIENEILTILTSYNKLSLDEQSDWSPILKYLKINQNGLDPKFQISRKTERRIIGLSQEIARLFLEYGRYAQRMIIEWESPDFSGWQPRLWRKLFCRDLNWTYPVRALTQDGIPQHEFFVHFFSISFITAAEFAFLERLACHRKVNYYLLSPCAVFWSDIRSDKESVFLQAYWRKKLGEQCPQLLNLDEFLRDRNPLLANFGRMGREMAVQIEKSSALTTALYVLPEKVTLLDDDIFIQDDLFLTDSKCPLSLLQALQADLLMMRNPQGTPVQIMDGKSVQLHIASCKRREIQILYNNLLKLMTDYPSICPSDIIVMSPQICDYVPYIQAIFGSSESQIEYQMFDLDRMRQSELARSFLQLIKLSESRWSVFDLFQLFEDPLFQRARQFSSVDFATFKIWIDESGIRWGDDLHHRNELLKRNHCMRGMADETPVGTWEYGFSRLLMGLTTSFDSSSQSVEISPCSALDFSQAEMLGKWIQLLHSLNDDLSPLNDRSRMTIEDWTNYLTCLLDSYFLPDYEDPESILEFEDLKNQFAILRNSARYYKEATYSFESVKAHLLSLWQNREISYREEFIQSVQFCTLVPLRSIPAKVIALLGMNDGAFPRTDQPSSLNQMNKNEAADYSPSPSDHDRYLFLEALQTAQEYLLISFNTEGQPETREPLASLVVQELFSYLDKHYNVNGKKVMEACVFKHPFDSFDKEYFEKRNALPNFSPHDFNTANAFYFRPKTAPFSLINHFNPIAPSNCENLEKSKSNQIDLKLLNAAVKNPIKLYLNKSLDIYLQSEEKRKIRNDEELTINYIDQYKILNSGLKDPLANVLKQAEKEGRMPFGLFKTTSIKNLEEKYDQMHRCLSKHAIQSCHLFQIEFCTTCSHPTQIEDDRWLFPAAKLQSDNGDPIFIVGKISYASSQGLVVKDKSSLVSAIEAWPQFVLYCHAVRLCPNKFQPRIIFAENGREFNAFFNNPDLFLQQLVKYYTTCLQDFSPLYPDWISYFLKEDVKGLKKKIEEIFSNEREFYKTQEIRWILNKRCLPDVENMIHTWKLQAQELFSEVVSNWDLMKEKRADDL